MTGHRSRVCHVVIDCDDLERGIAFWGAALGAHEEAIDPESQVTYRRLVLPDSEIRILLQKTVDAKVSKERVHLDVETDDIEAEVRRLEALGASRWKRIRERDLDYWVLRDPFGNELCVLAPEFPSLLDRRQPWPAR
jgi:predicted enzyme related to lactoylglutathione lyase